MEIVDRGAPLARCSITLLVFAMACRDSAPPPPTTIEPARYFEVAAPRAQVRVVQLTGAPPASLAVTAAHRKRGAAQPAGVAALWHVERNAARWGLSPVALATVEIAHVHDTGRGAIVVKLRQRVDGLEVVRSGAAVVMDRNLALVALSGELQAITTPPAIASGMSARRAIELAFADTGRATPSLTAVADHAGYQRFRAAGLAGPARARQVLFPSKGQLVRGWQSELGIRDGRRIDGVRHVHADDGTLLYRASLSHDATFAYRVWAAPAGGGVDRDHVFLDGPQGNITPHPAGSPNGFEGTFVAPTLVSIDGFNASHDPWLPAGATTTLGNNVDAYADLDFFDGFSAGDIRPTTTAPGVFDRTYNTSAEPDVSTAQQMASVTQLFYVNNWLHDYFYDSGFTEAAGNAQASNLGRGGAGGDVLLVEGQDSSGTDNANMFTPGDGESPVMQMFVFSAPPTGPRRDGTIDNHIVAHEWGHYFHHRLVNCGGSECRSMSEGWGDFIAMFSTLRAGDNLDGTWGLGGYAARTFTPNSAYFGIRRYPYSVDLAKNPLTLRMVRSGEPLPSGPAFSDIDFLQGSDNWEVHNSGEVWTSMLWQGTVDLVRNGGLPFAAAHRRYADYIVAGMLAAPVEPSYTEQRDAILAAAAATDSAHFVLLANAYAKRGFGTAAVAPPVNSFDGSGVVEDFAVRGALEVVSATFEEDAVSCDGDGVIDAGETGRVRVVVRNTGAAPLANPAISISSETAGVAFPSGTTATVSAIQPFATASATIVIRLDETPFDPHDIRLQIQASDAGAAVSPITRTLSARANFDITPAASKHDTFEETALVWTATPGGFALADDPGTSRVVAVDVAAAGDHRLQTPALQVATGQNLTLTFNHRHDFAQVGSFRDGGVIEISTNGTTFADVATVAAVPYLGAINGSGNVLNGRQAFGGTNASNPGFDQVSVDLGASFAGQTVVLRFRAGGDAANDQSRWEIDDVLIGGITNTPFPLFATETGSCLVGQRPLANAGIDVSVPSGGAGALDGTASTDPDGGALTFTWNQLSGPLVALSSTTVAQPTFTVPVTEPTLAARFQLIVRDPDNRVSEPSIVDVTIVGTGVVDGAPDAGVVDAAVDAPPGIDAAEPPPPDAGGNPIEGDGGGGCCDAGGDPRGALVLALGVLLMARRRRRG